jgi:hypothetical protein
MLCVLANHRAALPALYNYRYCALQMKGQWESNIKVWDRFMYSQNWNRMASLFPKQNYNVLHRNFHIHVSVPNRQIDPGQWWAAILKNVSIKAIQIHNFWEKNWIKRYNFVGQNFFHLWRDGKNQTKIFSAAMKRYNIPRYKSFTDEATQLPSILENVSITAILKIVSLKATEFSS